MKSKHIVLAVIGYFLFIFVQVAYAAPDYTIGKNVPNACHLFATDAEQAAWFLANGESLSKLLEMIEAAPIPDSQKDRAFQAIQFVWKNQLKDQTLAYNLAMGVCLSPRKDKAPVDDISFYDLRIKGLVF